MPKRKTQEQFEKDVYDRLGQIFEEKSSTTIEKFLVKNEVEQGISE